MHDKLIQLTERLLQSIAESDWETYEELCDPSLTAFEPEACGHLVEGIDFHRFYFDLEKTTSPTQTTLVEPHVRFLGEDVAIVCYNRLVQKLDKDGQPISVVTEETRVWQRHADERWQHMHFHRSA